MVDFGMIVEREEGAFYVRGGCWSGWRGLTKGSPARGIGRLATSSKLHRAEGDGGHHPQSRSSWKQEGEASQLRVVSIYG